MATYVTPEASLTARKRGSDVVRFGIVGYGYWGPKVVRNLEHQPKAGVLTLCDLNVAARKRAHKDYPQVEIVSDPSEVMTSSEIDAIAVVTPVWTHYELAKAALENGKHVFVEKPFTSNTAQAQELIELAEKKNLKVMVDHT